MHRHPLPRRRLQEPSHGDLYAASDELRGRVDALPDPAYPSLPEGDMHAGTSRPKPYADFVREIAPQLEAVVAAAQTLKNIILLMWPLASIDDERTCDKCNAVAVMDDLVLAIQGVSRSRDEKCWSYIRTFQDNYDHMLRSLNLP